MFSISFFEHLANCVANVHSWVGYALYMVYRATSREISYPLTSVGGFLPTAQTKKKNLALH